jgi:hypothetical protein
MDKLLSEYKQSNATIEPSDKQLEYIRVLVSQISDNDTRNIYDNLDIKHLTKKQIYNLIGELKGIIPANMYYLTLIHGRFTTKEISKLLKKDVSRDISQKEAEFILQGPDKFRPWIKEHPIRSEEQWEYGHQESDLFESGFMKYLKFYNMMMLDYDSVSYEDLVSHLNKFPYRFRIYKTYGGFHVFIISHLIPYNDEFSVGLSKQLLSDVYYIMFSNKTGYKIRLSKKKDRSEDFIAEYINEIGISSINNICMELIKIHDQLIKL